MYVVVAVFARMHIVRFYGIHALTSACLCVCASVCVFVLLVLSLSVAWRNNKLIKLMFITFISVCVANTKHTHSPTRTHTHLRLLRASVNYYWHRLRTPLAVSLTPRARLAGIDT